MYMYFMNENALKQSIIPLKNALKQIIIPLFIVVCISVFPLFQSQALRCSYTLHTFPVPHATHPLAIMPIGYSNLKGKTGFICQLKHLRLNS